MAQNLIAVDRDQVFLMPPSLRDWLAGDHLAWTVLQSAVFEDIEAFYNRQRRHSTLGMLSPTAYEQQQLSPLGG